MLLAWAQIALAGTLADFYGDDPYRDPGDPRFLSSEGKGELLYGRAFAEEIYDGAGSGAVVQAGYRHALMVFPATSVIVRGSFLSQRINGRAETEGFKHRGWLMESGLLVASRYLRLYGMTTLFGFHGVRAVAPPDPRLGANYTQHSVGVEGLYSIQRFVEPPAAGEEPDNLEDHRYATDLAVGLSLEYRRQQLRPNAAAQAVIPSDAVDANAILFTVNVYYRGIL